MSEPYWSTLGAKQGGVDYKGAWAVGTAYAQGDVVTYNGVTYLAVNPSTGVAPAGGLAGLDIGTALPTSPVDGQEFILTDSLTAPTYAWRLRYMSGKAANKWVFVGGSPVYVEDVSVATYNSVTFVAASVALALAVPVAGDYFVDTGMKAYVGSDQVHYMSYDIGGTAAADADAVANGVSGGGAPGERSVMRRRRKSLTAVTLTFKHRSSVALAVTVTQRWASLEPIAIGG